MKTNSAKSGLLASVKTAKSCIILLLMLTPAIASNASANEIPGSPIGGILDEPLTETAKGSATLNANSVAKAQKALKKEVRKEQRALEKMTKTKLKALAKSGERLAQVTLANDFADEAQLLTFAPVAANNALSDALKYYVLAAQRGHPGAASLENSGISFSPVRVVRNK